jgi:hypothetical protein
MHIEPASHTYFVHIVHFIFHIYFIFCVTHVKLYKSVHKYAYFVDGWQLLYVHISVVVSGEIAVVCSLHVLHFPHSANVVRSSYMVDILPVCVAFLMGVTVVGFLLCGKSCHCV